jgi:hypothetical protein
MDLRKSYLPVLLILSFGFLFGSGCYTQLVVSKDDGERFVENSPDIVIIEVPVPILVPALSPPCCTSPSPVVTEPVVSVPPAKEVRDIGNQRPGPTRPDRGSIGSRPGPTRVGK